MAGQRPIFGTKIPPVPWKTLRNSDGQNIFRRFVNRFLIQSGSDRVIPNEGIPSPHAADCITTSRTQKPPQFLVGFNSATRTIYKTSANKARLHILPEISYSPEGNFDFLRLQSFLLFCTIFEGRLKIIPNVRNVGLSDQLQRQIRESSSKRTVTNCNSIS